MEFSQSDLRLVKSNSVGENLDCWVCSVLVIRHAKLGANIVYARCGVVSN